MSLDRLAVRAASDVIGHALEWAAAEGWNPGIYDALAFSAVDPGGWFEATIDSEIVGCISVLRYDDAFAFVGFYIVKPEYRGNGYGAALWKTAMRHADGRNVGLDGVLGQVDNYSKSGFVLDVRNARYRGIGGGGANGGTGRVTRADLAEVLSYDRACFPAPREAFLRAWLTLPESFSHIARDSGKIVGYGTIRRCREGWKVGPLFANDASVAKRLFDDLSSHAGGAAVYLDVPTMNGPAVDLATRAGMEVVFETARMYTRGLPALAAERVFGVTSFELG